MKKFNKKAALYALGTFMIPFAIILMLLFLFLTVGVAGMVTVLFLSMLLLCILYKIYADVSDDDKEDITKKVTVNKVSRDDMVEEIMSNFDFEKVKKIMDYLDWRWRNDTTTPTIKELRKTALDCLNVVKYKDEYSTCSTGGFCACFEPFDGGTIKLSFNLTEDYISEDYY